MTELEIMDWVYSRLEDEESRFIFEKRKQFNETNDYKYIGEIIDKYVAEYSAYKWTPGKESEFITTIKESGKKVVIFGSGYYGKKILCLCKEADLNVDFFCDNDIEKQHKKVNDEILIISLQELMKKRAEEYIVIVSPKFAYNQITDMLLQAGFPKHNIYQFVDYTSRVLTTQYFDDEILHFEGEEVFVDGGCFDFRTSQFFIKKLESQGSVCKKVYAFEPDESNFFKCKNKIEKLKMNNVMLIQAGLWNADGYIKFAAQGNGSSHIVSSDESDDGEKVRVVALDECITDKVTFIKMDIEGSELEALRGAENILRRDKPKLAICIYHKKEDIWEIPYYIKKVVPEYKLYIRHYSNDAHETVLYAI